MRAKDALGRRGERLAAGYLRDCGHRLLDRNWRCRHGEIDLVSAHEGALVFTEVKTRASTRAGHPLEAVTPAKLARLRMLAGLWRQEHPEAGGRMRLDVIGIVLRPGRPGVLDHLRGV
ncbi:MAG: YraN family protein [Pseudoclavibacter sp.]|nr:YraN family protein [Pseudoclavibacter sp.]